MDVAWMIYKYLVKTQVQWKKNAPSEIDLKVWFVRR